MARSSRGNPRHYPAGSSNGGRFAPRDLPNAVISEKSEKGYEIQTKERENRKRWGQRCIKLQERFSKASDEQLAKDMIKLKALVPSQAKNALENGNIRKIALAYADALESNGNPYPSKDSNNYETYRGTWNLAVEKYDGDETKARIHKVWNATGLNKSSCASIESHINKWVENDNNKETQKWLDEYIENNCVYDGTIYRGMRFDLEDETFDKFTKLRIGAVIGMHGKNASWTSDIQTALWFARKEDNGKLQNSVLINCLRNKTSSLIAHYVDKEEYEVISHSKTRWTVLSTKHVFYDNGTQRVILDVIERSR